jgi:hypothetical protein
MSLRSTVVAAVVLVATVSVVSVLRAQDVSGRDEFVSAQEHYRAGEFVEAAEGFLRAYALDARAPFLHNAFLAWRSAGRPREALEALDRFLASTGEATPEDLTRLRGIREELVAEIASSPASQEGPDAAPITDPSAEPTSDAAGPSASDIAAAGATASGDASTVATSSVDPSTTGIEVPVEPGVVLLGLAGASLVWALVENRVVDGIVSSRDAQCTLGPMGDACPGTLDQQAYVSDFVLHRDLGYGALGLGLALGAIGGTLLGMALLSQPGAPTVEASCGLGGCRAGVSARW